LETSRFSDATASHTIWITGVRIDTTNGIERGFALAVAITTPVPVSKNEGEKFWQELYGKSPDQFLCQHIYSGSSDDLDNTSKRIVADFDSPWMDHFRQIRAIIAAQLAENAKAPAK
jgi:hypothetical protein